MHHDGVSVLSCLLVCMDCNYKVSVVLVVGSRCAFPCIIPLQKSASRASKVGDMSHFGTTTQPEQVALK